MHLLSLGYTKSLCIFDSPCTILKFELWSTEILLYSHLLNCPWTLYVLTLNLLYNLWISTVFRWKSFIYQNQRLNLRNLYFNYLVAHLKSDYWIKLACNLVTKDFNLQIVIKISKIHRMHFDQISIHFYFQVYFIKKFENLDYFENQISFTYCWRWMWISGFQFGWTLLYFKIIKNNYI